MDLFLNGFKTIYDDVWYKDEGFGLELSVSLKNNSKFSPQLDLTSDGYGATYPLIDKRIAGKSVDKGIVNNIFFGSSYQVANHIMISYSIGTSFINSYIYLGMKPELQYSFFKNDRIKVKFSLTHIRPKYGGKVEPYGYLGLGIGYRLF